MNLIADPYTPDKNPGIVYKYRKLDNELHFNVIKELHLYLSSPKEFEDKDDCKLRVNFEKASKDELEKYLQHSKKAEDIDIPKRVQQLLSNPQELIEIKGDYIEDFNNKIGILSLCCSCKLKTMWEKYANGGNGICYGFNMDKLNKILGGGNKVTYKEYLPNSPIYSMHDRNSTYQNQVYMKSIEWNFEEEYRCMKMYENNATQQQRTITYSIDALQEIIFGWHVPQTCIDYIVEIAKSHQYEGKYYQISRDYCILNEIKL